MHKVAGVVDIERNFIGDAGVAVAKGVDHPQFHPRQHPPVHRVLQPGERRLRRQPDISVGTLVAGHLQHRVVAQCIEIVAVLMPAGDGDHARLDDGGIRVNHPPRIARIGDAGGQKRAQLPATPGFAQQQCPAIRGHRPASESCVDIEAIDG